MYPVLLKLGPITIYSFGLMVALAFIIANSLFIREMRRRKLPDADTLSSNVTLLALIGGILGAKTFHLLENPAQLMRDPMGAILSGEGLTFFGGLLMAIGMIMLYLRRKHIPFLHVADAASPSLMIAYGIGRIGCQLAGDGDYGLPTDLPWAMSYPNGMVSTLAARNPELVEYFRMIFPGRPVPEDIMVHPAPVYETLTAFAFFAILWKLRTQPRGMGWIFGVYLILAGIERFFVEFIRINPLYMGLSQAQWIALALIVGGLLLMNRSNRISFQTA
jgi:phosphatidylglycerol:prolipoprotein diacylglycerol transferase